MNNINNLTVQALTCVRFCLNELNNFTSFDLIVVRLESLEAAIYDVQHTTSVPWAGQVLHFISHAIFLLLQEIEIHSFETNIGRPAFIIPVSSIEHLLSLKFKATDIAKMYDVSRHTIHRRLKQHNLSVSFAQNSSCFEFVQISYTANSL